MSDFMMPIAGAAVIAAYWYVCRVRSLDYREKAAELLTAYFDKNSVSEEDKDDAERFYMMARSWFFLPLLTVFVFPVLLFRTLSKRPDNKPSKDRTAITDAVMKMYLTRHPITGTICLTGFCIGWLLAFFVGLLINHVRALPNPSATYMSVIRVAMPGSWRHHH